MPQKWKSDDVEEYPRIKLAGDGYDLTPPLGNGQTGPDIVASKNGVKIHFEAIGYKSKPPDRSKDFYEVFFRSISRLKDGATQCVIALPAQFGVGMRQRVDQYGIAWERLGNSFPELSIWLVDTDGRKHTEHAWNAWIR